MPGVSRGALSVALLESLIETEPVNPLLVEFTRSVQVPSIFDGFVITLIFVPVQLVKSKNLFVLTRFTKSGD